MCVVKDVNKLVQKFCTNLLTKNFINVTKKEALEF